MSVFVNCYKNSQQSIVFLFPQFNYIVTNNMRTAKQSYKYSAEKLING